MSSTPIKGFVMPRTFKLDNIAGVRVRFHDSWLVALALLILTLVVYLQSLYPGWSRATLVAISCAISLAFGLAMFLETVLVANLTKYIGTSPISGHLYALGYFPRITRSESYHPSSPPSSDWLSAMISWILKIAVGAAFLLAATWIYGTSPARIPSTPGMAILVWMGYLHLFLAMANLIPGYPLDAGRVLAAGLNGLTQDAERSTVLAAQTGKITGIILIGLGAVLCLGTPKLMGFWVLVIGLFACQASAFITQQTSHPTELVP